MSQKLAGQQKGVTLIELMIATTIFSVVLVIIIYAFLFVTNDYTKGTVEAQTQETARAIMEQISQDVQLNNGTFALAKSGNGFCVGSDQYSFQYNKELGSGSTDVKHALVVQSGVSDCSNLAAQSFTSGTIIGKELLGNHMRLGYFAIVPSGGGQYTISITIAYGDDNITQDGPLVPKLLSSGHYTYTCPSINLGGNYCAVTTLSTVVQQRVINGS